MGKHDGSREWIPAVEALDALYPHHGGYHGTKLFLAELLKDGELKARAGQRWTSDRPSLDAAWRNRDKAESEENVELDEADWADSRFWSEDLDNWRWRKNRFVLTSTKRPAKRTFLVDVDFRASQVNLLLPSKRRGLGGRNIRAADWQKIGVVLIDLAREGFFGAESAPADGKPRVFKNVSEFVGLVMERSDHAYNQSHAFELLGPVYEHFFPQTDPLSSRTKGPDRF